MAKVITCRRTPATIRGDDGEVGGRGALLTGLQQSETLYVVTSVHDSRGYATRVEKSQPCERLYEPQRYPQSAEALRVESVRIVETEPSKKDEKPVESGESVKKEVAACALRTENGVGGGIFHTGGGYKITEDEEEEVDEGGTFYSLFSLEDMPFLQNEDPLYKISKKKYFKFSYRFKLCPM